MATDLGTLGVTAAYLAAAALVVYRQSLCSRLCAAFLVLLAVERQISLGSRIGVELRQGANDFGWYGDRAALQIAATIFVVVMAIVATSLLMRRVGRDLMVSAGVGSLIVLGAIRLLSLHPIDRVLSHETFGVSTRVILELAVLLFIGLSAVLTTRPRHVASFGTK